MRIKIYKNSIVLFLIDYKKNNVKCVIFMINRIIPIVILNKKFDLTHEISVKTILKLAKSLIDEWKNTFEL